MAMTQQQQNHVARLMEVAARLIALKLDIDILRAEWDQNGFYYDPQNPADSAISTDDLATVAAYAHLGASELGNAMGALTDVRDTLGDYVDGPITHLVKLRG